MLNKNDPLIGAVQEVMRKNHAEREAIKAVNEKFGVTDRKALPHENQSAWDTAYKQVLNESDEMGPVNAKKNEGQLYRHKKSGKEKGLPEKVDEGFNNRHDLSVNASAEKQVVAVLNEVKKKIVPGVDDDGTEGHRPASGGGFSPSQMPTNIGGPDRTKGIEAGGAGRRFSAGSVQPKATSKIRSGPKTRTRIVRKQTSAAQQGTMQGQVAKMRQQSGDVAPVRMGMNPADRAKIRIDQAKRDVRRDPGSSVRQSTAPAPNAAGALRRPPGQQSRPPVNTQGQGSMLSRPTNTSSVIRRGGLSNIKISKRTGKAISGALTGAGLGAVAVAPYVLKPGSSINQPPPAQAEPKKKLYTDKVPEEKPNKTQDEPKTQEIPQRKLDTPTRKVTDTQIMNAPQYKQAVKDVGGEAAARRIQPGRDVAGVGPVEKGETIWSKVKSQLEKQPEPAPKGFEMRNEKPFTTTGKGGAGR